MLTVCPSDYVYNSYTETCFKRITVAKNWDDAKQHCELDGEYLATFATLEAAQYFTTLIQTAEGKLC